MSKGKPGGLRVALFPDSYNEVDGVAVVSQNLEAFAKKRHLQFLTIHAGACDEIMTSGSITKLQLTRGRFTFPLDRAHQYDLGFWRHYRRVVRVVQDFGPDVIQITGPSDVGMLGALVAHKLSVPLAAFWQTNLHQYARCRLSGALSKFPSFLKENFLSTVEAWILRAAMRYYRIPQLLFAPNEEMVTLLRQSTGKSCFLMPHGVDNETFNPKFRTSEGGPFTIGYVGRLTAEKNVHLLAQLESALFSLGHRDFRILIVGEGPEAKWLRKNMRNAQFTGVLSGQDLSRAFANMDLFVFPSETDTFGLVVLEAHASGVPAVVSSIGGPKNTVRHGETGYIAQNFEDFVRFTKLFLLQPELRQSMGKAARGDAVSSSWDEIFEGLYKRYKALESDSEPISAMESPKAQPIALPSVR